MTRRLERGGRLLLASHNRGKLAEIRALIEPYGLEVVAAAELDRLCLDHIARFKRPRDYRFVETLPKNNYGKVLKSELRRLLQRP